MPAAPGHAWKAAHAMTLSFYRIITGISVRTRIIVLAVIPVVGFLVNGIAFTAGEREVEQRVPDRRSRVRPGRRQPRVPRRADPDARADARLRRAAEPGADPGFETTHDTRGPHACGIIEAAVDAPTRQQTRAVEGQLEEIAAQFDDLARNQKILGFTEAEGIRDRMTKAAAAVERIIHEDMSWLSEGDAHKLLISLLTMRRYEAEYRLTRSTLMQTVFFDEFKKFQEDRGRRRRRRRAEAAAGAAGESLQRHVRRMDRVRRQGRSAGCGDRIQRQEHDAGRRRDHRLGEGSHQCGGGGAHGVATADPDHHHRRRALRPC